MVLGKKAGLGIRAPETVCKVILNKKTPKI